MIQVYHGEQLVAEVMTDSLDTAYYMTQNINCSWSKTRLVFNENGVLVENDDFHPEVQVMAPLHTVNGREYGLRSTMVGDVMVRDGVKYRVKFVGFEQI